MSDPLLSLAFVGASLVSLAASWRLVVALERIGARLGLSESLLGMLAALAADGPEITAATTALLGHDDRIGAGVVIGSNVFNLAALLGLAGVIAGHIGLHRRVIELSGLVAVWVGLVTLATVTATISPAGGLALALCGMLPYLYVLGASPSRRERLALPAGVRRWLEQAIREEELELEPAIHPRRGGRGDALEALTALAVVIGASTGMEQAGATLGHRLDVAAILIGALVLAAVTSLPNAVAAIYLARRERGPAVLSTALNSNAINVLAGLLAPTALLGIAGPAATTTFVTASYLAMTLLALGLAYAGRGLTRAGGATIIGCYALFCVALVAIS